MTSEDYRETLEAELCVELDASKSVVDFRTLLQRIDQNRESVGIEKAAEIAWEANASLRELTSEIPDVAAELIIAQLLPWCELPLESPKQANVGYRFRELLRNWIYGYPQEHFTKLRETVLECVCGKLKKKPTKELLWVVATMGYRSELIAEVVQPLLKQPGAILDRAFGTLEGLGADPAARAVLLNLLREKIQASEETRGMLVAIQELVGPDQIDLATEFLRQAAERTKTGGYSHDFAVAVAVVTKALGRCPAESHAHVDIWAILRANFSTIRGSGQYAARCNTKETLTDCVRWMLDNEIGGNPESGAYIMLSRLGELVSPVQLAAWDDASSPELVDFLRQAATNDTKISGQFVTTSAHLKREAWETALTLGCTGIPDWIELAVVDETNSYFANDIANIVACLRIEATPKRVLDAIRCRDSAEEEDQHFFRQSGLIEIARSSCSRKAFEALLRFELTHEGNVLFSTIDAITDVAVARIESGDTDVVHLVLEMTAPSASEHHRAASVSVFCRLCRGEFVGTSTTELLREFVIRQDVDEFSRREAMETIGFLKALHSEWAPWVKKFLQSEDEELGWRACEVLIRQEWVAEADEGWLFDRLGLSESKAQMQIVGRIDGRQAYMIGLMFQKEENRYASAVCQIVRDAPVDVVHHILGSLRFLGRKCPESIAFALADRCTAINSGAYTDTEFFEVLGKISPKVLLSLANGEQWRDWIAAGRAALCDTIAKFPKNDEKTRIQAVASLVEFLRDPAYQVRRSGYRALSGVDTQILERICQAWKPSNDIDLRKRVAEAVEWLPSHSYPDTMIEELGLAWDTERAVREIWKEVPIRRRQRELAVSYVDRLVTACRTSSDPVISEYRYGRALTKIGDDQAIAMLEEFIATTDLRPNVRHWLEKVVKETEKNWKLATEKWPEPWSTQRGAIEQIDGVITGPECEPRSVRLFLFCQYRTAPSNLGEWGGVAEFTDGRSSFAFDPGTTVEITIHGRSKAVATVFESSWTSNRSGKLTFSGRSDYPASTRRDLEENVALEPLTFERLIDLHDRFTTSEMNLIHAGSVMVHDTEWAFHLTRKMIECLRGNLRSIAANASFMICAGALDVNDDPRLLQGFDDPPEGLLPVLDDESRFISERESRKIRTVYPADNFSSVSQDWARNASIGTIIIAPILCLLEGEWRRIFDVVVVARAKLTALEVSLTESLIRRFTLFVERTLDEVRSPYEGSDAADEN